MKLTIPEQPGRCRWCGCTDDDGCAMGCTWENPRHTLCSGCADLDRAVRTIEGRARLAVVIQDEIASSLT